MSDNNNIRLQFPFYLDAEQFILGIIFVDPKQMLNIEGKLEITDFYNLNHQLIFSAMQDLFQQNKDIDYYSVYAFLETKKQKIVGGKEYLIDLGSQIPSVYHLDTYIEFVKEASLKRDIINTAMSVVRDGFDNVHMDSQNYLNIAEEKIFQISRKKKNTKFVELKTLLKEIERKTIYNRRENNIIGLRTGYENLDNITLGFKPEELIILAARPSMGKSSFMMNLAVNIAKQNKNKQAAIAIFSLEMSNEQLGSRMLSAQSNVPHRNIQLGFLNPQQLNVINGCSQQLQKLNIYFDDSSSVNILDIRTQCRQLKYKNKLDIIIIDYLQLIRKSNKNNQNNFYNRQEEVSDISQSLKQMARELKVPVIALSQLSREVEKREDKKPILSDLRDSGSIEQDADIVMFLYRKNYYAKEKDKREEIKEDLGYTELIISKNRQGATGLRKFSFNSECLLFTEIDDVIN
ncbi:replicative DNA helicase [Candidatus Phytoplasma pini]|uniref:Replicative DNA helicase n=1 Tax=Candidatus Phytoplasma pini TaxID=267362 RepID=A0A559KJA5_9MOLU|nr:replicative DNA helicase [Candidatus Phytoplasma pini]TVY12215.1 replicative DNA helicase [Candidatus Phytoplasma pini]